MVFIPHCLYQISCYVHGLPATQTRNAKRGKKCSQRNSTMFQQLVFLITKTYSGVAENVQGRNRSKIWASRSSREEGAQSLNFSFAFLTRGPKTNVPCLPEIVLSGHAEGERRKCLYVYVSMVKKWWVLLGRRKRVIFICESCHFIGGVSIFHHYGMFILILRDFCKVHSPGFNHPFSRRQKAADFL